MRTTSGREGSVKPNPEKPGTWMFVVDLAQPGDPRQQVRRRGFATKKAAREALDALKAEVRGRTYVDRAKGTLATFVEETYLPYVQGQVRPATYSSYARNLRLHVLRDLGAIEVQRLTARHWQQQLGQLARDGRADHALGTGLSRRSVRYVHTITKAMLDYAVQEGLLSANPISRVKPPRPDAQGDEHESFQVWTRTELAGFLVRADREQHQHRAAWLLLATTGARRGEVLGLPWSAVDLDAGRLSFRRTLVDMDGDQPVWSDPKTAKGRRSIALDSRTVVALRAHRARQLEQRVAVGAGYRKEHDLVFAMPDGRPLHPDRFSRTFVAMAGRWGFPRIRLHDLRHTWATLALESGINPKVVQERLGHSSVSITLGIYSHVTQSMESDAAERVAGLILGTEP